MRKYNLYVTFGEAYDLEWMLWDLALHLSFVIPAAVFFAAIDSFRVGRVVKITVLLCFEAQVLYLYIQHRYLSDEWADAAVCIRRGCLFSAKLIYLSTSSQLMVFLAKIIFAYQQSLPFAFLRPNFVLPEADATRFSSARFSSVRWMSRSTQWSMGSVGSAASQASQFVPSTSIHGTVRSTLGRTHLEEVAAEAELTSTGDRIYNL